MTDLLHLSPADREAWLRGHVSLDEAAAVLGEGYHVASVSPAYAHHGWGVDENGDRRRMIYIGARHGRGWFAVTIADVREIRSESDRNG